MKEPGEPKQPDESPLFEIYKAFSTPSETAEFTQMLADGLAWGEAKNFRRRKSTPNWQNCANATTH